MAAEGARPLGDPGRMAEIQRRYAGTDCFACGPDNPEGLHMQFRLEGDEVVSEVELRPTLCGWKGVAHGGMVSLLLDEIASWCFAVCVHGGGFATRELRVRFLRPTPVAERLRASARLVRVDERSGHLLAELRRADGQLTARAEVEIVRLDEERYQRFLKEAQGESA